MGWIGRARNTPGGHYFLDQCGGNSEFQQLRLETKRTPVEQASSHLICRRFWDPDMKGFTDWVKNVEQTVVILEARVLASKPLYLPPENPEAPLRYEAPLGCDEGADNAVPEGGNNKAKSPSGAKGVIVKAKVGGPKDETGGREGQRATRNKSSYSAQEKWEKVIYCPRFHHVRFEDSEAGSLCSSQWWMQGEILNVCMNADYWGRRILGGRSGGRAGEGCGAKGCQEGPCTAREVVQGCAHPDLAEAGHVLREIPFAVRIMCLLCCVFCKLNLSGWLQVSETGSRWAVANAEEEEGGGRAKWGQKRKKMEGEKKVKDFDKRKQHKTQEKDKKERKGKEELERKKREFEETEKKRVEEQETMRKGAEEEEGLRKEEEKRYQREEEARKIREVEELEGKRKRLEEEERKRGKDEMERKKKEEEEKGQQSRGKQVQVKWSSDGFHSNDEEDDFSVAAVVKQEGSSGVKPKRRRDKRAALRCNPDSNATHCVST